MPLLEIYDYRKHPFKHTHTTILKWETGQQVGRQAPNPTLISPGIPYLLHEEESEKNNPQQIPAKPPFVTSWLLLVTKEETHTNIN